MRVLFFVALLTAVDQLTKYWAVVHLKPIGSVAIVPGFFSLTYVENRGAAWGMLAGRHIFLIGFSLLTLAFLCWRRRQLFDHLWGGRVTFTLLVGGILGALERVTIDSPIVIRLDGTNADEGRAILKPHLSDKLQMAPTMLEAARVAVELAKR